MRLFVYGTLMRGESNHRMLEGARFVRVARTVAEYTLVSLGAFPAMLEGGTTSVRGEIYEVEEGMLAALDRFEGVPRFYERKPVRTARCGDVDAYLMRRQDIEGVHLMVVRSGKWRNVPKGTDESTSN